MIVHGLGIGNFMLFESATVNLCSTGLVALQGVNLEHSASESNGSGKSTLMEALRWVLWGTTFHDVDPDAVIHIGSKKAHVNIELESEDDGAFYLIDRQRMKGKGGVSVYQRDAAGDYSINLTKGTDKLTQEFIAKLLGCTEDVFCAAVYIGQEKLPNLPMMTDKALKEMVEEAAGVKILEDAYSRAKERAAKAKMDVSNAMIQVSTERHKLAALGEAILREKDHEAKFELDRTHAMAEYDRLSVKLGDEHDELVAQRDLMPHRSDLQAKVDSFKAVIFSIADQKAEEKRLSDKLAELNKWKNSRSVVLKMQIESLNDMKADLAGVQDQVGKPCRECGSLMTQDHIDPARASWQSRIDAQRDVVSKTVSLYKSDQEAAEAAALELAAYQGAMSDPSTVLLQSEEAINELTKYDSLQAKIDAIKKEWTKVAESFDELCNKENPHAKILEELSLKENNIHADLVMSEEEQAALEDVLRDEENARDVFSPSGVRAHILDTVTPYLNARTSECLSILSDGTIQATWTTLTRNAKGDVREKFGIDVVQIDGAQSFRGLSGGEQRKVRVACALALQDLVASRATKPFGLWVADEIDTALDPAGLERLMIVLAEKAKERGSVIVISHSDLRDWIPTAWTVTRENKKSVLSV